MRKGSRRISEKVVVIHDQFVKYGRNAREWMRKCEILLPHVERERVWEKKGFGSIYEYAAKLAGMSRNRVDVVLWTMRKVEGKEELLKVVDAKGVNAVKAIANMVTNENQSFWAEKASEMSVHTLETYAKEFREIQEAGKLNGLLDSRTDRNSFHVERKVVGMDLEKEVMEELEKLRGAGDWNALMKELLEMRRAKLEAEKPETVKVMKKMAEQVQQMPEKKLYYSRTIPKKIQQYVIKKTNGMCAFPGCKKHGKIFHHIDRLALNPEHDPDRIVLLCKYHERLVHMGLVEDEQVAPKYWRVLEWSNKESAKWKVDKLVQQYRRVRV